MGGIKYLEAIGKKPKRGRPKAGPSPSKADLVKLYIEEEKSIRDVAAALECSKDAVYRGLNKYGIEARASAKRSKLGAYSSEFLLGNIRKLGFQATANTFGVNVTTLRRYMKSKILYF
jgi:hypothetical protein